MGFVIQATKPSPSLSSSALPSKTTSLPDGSSPWWAEDDIYIGLRTDGLTSRTKSMYASRAMREVVCSLYTLGSYCMSLQVVLRWVNSALDFQVSSASRILPAGPKLWHCCQTWEQTTSRIARDAYICPLHFYYLSTAFPVPWLAWCFKHARCKLQQDVLLNNWQLQMGRHASHVSTQLVNVAGVYTQLPMDCNTQYAYGWDKRQNGGISCLSDWIDSNWNRTFKSSDGGCMTKKRYFGRFAG